MPVLLRIIFASVLFFSSFSVKAVSNHQSSPGDLPASAFVELTPVELSAMTGKKLSFLEKLYFKSLQRKIKRDLKRDKEVDLSSYFNAKQDGFTFDPLWFVLGVIIGPLALLFSFTTMQKKNSKISALIGFGIFVIWFGYLFLF